MSKPVEINQLRALQSIAASLETITGRAPKLPVFAENGDPIVWHFTQADLEKRDKRELEKRDKRQQAWAANECLAILSGYVLPDGVHQNIFKEVKERFNL